MQKAEEPITHQRVTRLRFQMSQNETASHTSAMSQMTRVGSKSNPSLPIVTISTTPMAKLMAKMTCKTYRKPKCPGLLNLTAS